MDYQRSNLTEDTEKKVKLNNEDISIKDFNTTLESLKPNQRIIETSDHNFHLVERMQG